MAGYFGAALGGALQGYNQAAQQQPENIMRMLQIQQAIRAQQLQNMQLQASMQAQGMQYQPQARQDAPMIPPQSYGQVSPDYFGPQAPSPGQASVPMKQPGAGVGPHGILPYLPMQAHVAAAQGSPVTNQAPIQQVEPPKQAYVPTEQGPQNLDQIEASLRAAYPNASPLAVKMKASEIFANQGKFLQQQKEAAVLRQGAFGRVQPKDYTPDSIKIYQKTGDASDLVPIAKSGTEQHSTIAKLNMDYKAGLIDKPTYDAAIRKATHVPVTMASIYLGQGGAGSVGKPTPGKGGMIAGMTPDAIDIAATSYRSTGKMPSTGWGILGQLQKAAIANRAAEQAKELGQDSKAVFLEQQGMKANTTALNQVTKQRSMVLAFEDTAIKNADQVLQASSQVDRTGSPAINRWILAGRKSIAGDPAVARLDLAMRAFINEYARVTSSVTGGGVTSDTARKEIETALNSAMAVDQVKAVIGQAKIEMENRRQGYDDQINELKGQIGGASSQPVAAQAGTTTAPIVLKFDAQGNLVK